MKALLIPADGSKPVEVIDWDGKFPSMYKLLDCGTIEHSYPADHPDVILLCDEEAFCHDTLPQENERAARIVSGRLLGNVAAVGALNPDGDYASLSQKDADDICKKLAIPTITL